jgi:hypothetical protein
MKTGLSTARKTSEVFKHLCFRVHTGSPGLRIQTAEDEWSKTTTIFLNYGNDQLARPELLQLADAIVGPVKLQPHSTVAYLNALPFLPESSSVESNGTVAHFCHLQRRIYSTVSHACHLQ